MDKFEEDLAFVICSNIANPVSKEYWNELKAILIEDNSNEQFLRRYKELYSTIAQILFPLYPTTKKNQTTTLFSSTSRDVSYPYSSELQNSLGKPKLITLKGIIDKVNHKDYSCNQKHNSKCVN